MKTIARGIRNYLGSMFARPAPRPRRPRLGLEPLEDRIQLAASPVNLGQHLQFRLLDPTANWTNAGGVYSATGQVMISLQAPSFQSLLVVDTGIQINTNPTTQSFTIKATRNAPNSLSYFPNASL